MDKVHSTVGSLSKKVKKKRSMEGESDVIKVVLQPEGHTKTRSTKVAGSTTSVEQGN